MVMSYKFIEGLTLADVAFEATGSTLEELFESAGLAVTKTQIENLDTIKHTESLKIKLNAETFEQLLHDFLQEIIFYKDAKLLLFNKYSIKINENHCKLEAVLLGEKIDMSRHELLVDVKAITWHYFSLKKNNDKWIATVVVDV
ncbi:MAG: archease [Candidatus Aenigmarchaeota archaeon]|nr:archease [Candidatus Aenigmarchaeota archaeon]